LAIHLSTIETNFVRFSRSLIFGSGNHDLEFIGCLCHCLLQLTLTLKIS
jgi:hypothetical protein